MSSGTKRTLVIGIGGMGGNTLNYLTSNTKLDYTLLTINTDAQALDHSRTRYNLLIGQSICYGLGTGRNAAIGREAAAKSLGEIRTYLDYADKICLVAGLGGGTGSGAIQVISRHALDLGKEVFCIVSTPFRFEGKDADLVAQEAIRELDHIGVQKMVFNNEDLFVVAKNKPTFGDAFAAAVKAISERIAMIVEGGDINNIPPLAIEIACDVKHKNSVLT